MSKTYRGLEELSDLAIVTETDTQTVTNKTIVVADNTITTAASGNLEATELNAALSELQSDIDTRATSTALSDHIGDTSDAHAASAITNTPSGGVAATTVQAAINELDGDITAHLDDTTDAHDASAISVLDTGDYFTGTDVESVLQEVGADLGTVGLQYFTENRNTTAPNDTVGVNQLLASVGTNTDVAFTPSGEGAVLAHVPDGTIAGGNKRGVSAVDFQTSRTNAAHVSSGERSVISGGSSGTSSGAYSVIGGGNANTSSGDYSSINGGATNIANASYSTVCGGQSNTAITNTHTFIGGGLSNVASGQYAAIAGGRGNAASGIYSAVFGGWGNDAGDYSSVAGGQVNAASGNFSYVGGGAENTASGVESFIPGGRGGTTRGSRGKEAVACGSFLIQGDAQLGRHPLSIITTDATPAILCANGAAGATPETSSVPTLPDDHAYKVNAYVIAREDATGDVKEWELSGLVTRGTGAATVAFVGTPSSTSSFASAGAVAWTAELVVNTTRGSVEAEVTGEAAHTIHWVCKLNTVEVG